MNAQACRSQALSYLQHHAVWHNQISKKRRHCSAGLVAVQVVAGVHRQDAGLDGIHRVGNGRAGVLKHVAASAGADCRLVVVL
jgi:hypothetical protein